MKRLIIFRHAKAVPHDAAPDFDRALAERGREDAEETGRYLLAEQLLPDLALVSPALRTRETWEFAGKALPETALRYDKRLYDASDAMLLAVIRSAEDAVRTLVVVGHNPSMGDLSRALVGHGDRYAFARLTQSFPTSAICVLDFAVDHWVDVTQGGGRLDRFVTPAGEHD